MAGYKGHLAGGGIAAGVGSISIIAAGTYLKTATWVPQYFSALSHWITGTWRGLLYLAVMGGICLLFSLWPDVDIDSKGQRAFGMIFTVTIGALISIERFKEAAIIGLFAALPMASRHRGWTHRWWAAVLVPTPIALIPWFQMPEIKYMGIPLYIAAVLGYWTHLVIDGTW